MVDTLGPQRFTLRDVMPFAVAVIAAVASLTLVKSKLEPGKMAIAAAMLLAIWLVGVVAARQPVRRRLRDIAALALFAAIAVARDGAGGFASGTAPLLAVPIIWIALHGSKGAMRLAGVCTALSFVIPHLLDSGEKYPLSDWRQAAIWTSVAVFVGPVIQDVVARLEVQERAQRTISERFTALMQAATEHSVIATDLDGLITVFSEGASQMLGYRAVDVIGLMTPEAIHDPDEMAAVAAELGTEPGLGVLCELARRGHAGTRQWTYIACDRSRRLVRVAVGVMRGVDGEIDGYIAIAIDITDEETARRRLADAELRWRLLLDHLPEIVVMVVDDELTYVHARGAGLQRQGAGDVRGRTLHETSSAVNVAVLEPLYRSALDGREGVVEIASSVGGFVNRIVATPLPTHGMGRTALVVAQDISELRERETALRFSEQRARRLFDEAPYPAVVLSRDSVVLVANPAFGLLVGCDMETLTGSALARFVPEPSWRNWTELLDEVWAGATGRAELDQLVLDPDGEPLDVSAKAILLYGADEQPEFILVNLVDVTVRRRYEQQLAHLAEHDPLTGLANRRRFDADLTAHLALCRRQGLSGAVVMLDLDHFKEINDTLGHGAGDELIVATAHALRRRMRETDTIARLGGDEFALLLPDVDRDGASIVGEQILQAIRRDVEVPASATRREVTCSVGIVMIENIDLTGGELLSLADLTMYDAKEAGRDRFELLDTTLYSGPRTQTRMVWAQRIKDALVNDGFVAHAQPIVDLSSMRIAGAELLLRMRDLDGSLIMPGRFIYIAERAGLIADLDLWTLGQGLALLERLRISQPEFKVAVNVSGRSIGDPRYADTIAAGLTKGDIDPSRLVLEITETAAIADMEQAKAFVVRMSGLGCELSLDDFGAGFGSFYYLKHFTFDYVKIDGEFVSRCPFNRTDRLIVDSIVGIAHGLGKTTVAEHIADEPTLTAIRTLGVDYGQGYLLGRPGPIEDLLARFDEPDHVIELPLLLATGD